MGQKKFIALGNKMVRAGHAVKSAKEWQEAQPRKTLITPGTGFVVVIFHFNFVNEK